MPDIIRDDVCHQRMVVEGPSLLKALAILSLGLNIDDGTPIFNPSVLPWSAAACPTALKMTAKYLRKEISRCSVSTENVLHGPHPNQYTVSRATNWLVENPIIAEVKVAFIKHTISL